MRILLVILSISLFSTNIWAQQSDREFAEYYYNNKEYDKAALYFSKLYEQQTGSYYYGKLMSCYEAMEAYEQAIDLAKNHIRKNKNAFAEHFDLALLYRRVSEDKKAQKALEDGFENIPPNRGLISQVGRKLENEALYEAAQKLYEEAQRLNLGYGFQLELAGLYGVQGETKKMVDAYLLLVVENPAYKNSVQSALLRYLDFLEDGELSELLRTSLLEAVQNHSENKHLAEVLIWYYYQTGQYAAAFTQVRALDLRYKEDGRRVLEYAQLAARNDAFTAAYMAYDYLEQQYPGTGMLPQVLMQKAKMAYLELQQGAAPDAAQITRVSDAFDRAIEVSGINSNSASLLIDYADFTLKFGAGTEAAKALLNQVLNIPSLYNKVQALAKLRLADILLIENNVWQAAMLYGQVDKDFKEDELGALARLSNAKIAFYTGDFEWSQAQLDVLKAGTSELISNDAIELSLLIGNNYNLDTVTRPLELYAAADLAVLQRKYGQADKYLDSLTTEFKNHSLADEVLMVRYKMAMQEQQYEQAAELLLQICEDYPFDLLGDNAIYLLAELYLNQLNNPEKAAELYERLLKEYPGSLFIIDARKKYRRLRGDKHFEG